MAEYTTLAPTGLQVTRKGSEFTFSWVIRDQDHGGGQLFQYNFGGRDKKWHAVQVTEKQTSVVLTINTSLVTKLSFRVRGRRKAFTQKKDKDTITIKPRVSAWAGKIPAWVPAMPTKPTVEYERTSANTGTFTVKHKADDDGRRVVNYVQYQSCASTTTAYPPKSGWSATTNLNGKVDVDVDRSYTEQNENIQKTGVVRWFRARCTGPGGTTGWVYSRHAYSKPVAPALKSASAAKQANRGITNITANWKSTTNIKQPIDEETLQYCIGKPVDNACNAPSNGWTDALTVTPTGKKDVVTASVEARHQRNGELLNGCHERDADHQHAVLGGSACHFLPEPEEPEDRCPCGGACGRRDHMVRHHQRIQGCEQVKRWRVCFCRHKQRHIRERSDDFAVSGG